MNPMDQQPHPAHESAPPKPVMDISPPPKPVPAAMPPTPPHHGVHPAPAEPTPTPPPPAESTPQEETKPSAPALKPKQKPAPTSNTPVGGIVLTLLAMAGLSALAVLAYIKSQ
ncbi:MAG TPA: hypothetical protein VMY99_01160 [Nevskiaceae bacterium]|nr:hypothetical protein [Nevskiaceae bacterium]